MTLVASTHVLTNAQKEKGLRTLCSKMKGLQWMPYNFDRLEITYRNVCFWRLTGGHSSGSLLLDLIRSKFLVTFYDLRARFSFPLLQLLMKIVFPLLAYAEGLVYP